MPIRKAGKLGRLPDNPAIPRMKWDDFYNPTYTPPTSAIYDGMPTIGYMGNDSLGDCVCACMGHNIEMMTYNGQGTETVVTTAQCIAMYEVVAGWTPGSGEGNGSSVVTGLAYLQSTGLAGKKISAYAQLTPSNLTQIYSVIAEFGTVTIGFNVYNGMMTAFSNGQPWTTSTNTGGIAGGHCVDIIGYDATYFYLYTWGAIQKATIGWWSSPGGANTSGGEAWACIGTEWVSLATGLDPEGVNQYAYGQAYATVTGGTNPFPAPSDVVTVNNPGTQAAVAGTAISPLAITASSSASPTSAITTFTATGTPAGLTATASGGTLTFTGTPTTAVVATVTATATDANGTVGSTSFTWDVTGAPPSTTVTITNPGTQTTVVNTPISSLILIAVPTLSHTISTFTISGLPTGVTSSLSGTTMTITGTPTTVENTTVTATATDSSSSTGTVSFAWDVITSSPPTPPDSADVALAALIHPYLNLSAGMQTWLTAKGL